MSTEQIMIGVRKNFLQASCFHVNFIIPRVHQVFNSSLVKHRNAASCSQYNAIISLHTEFNFFGFLHF